MADPEAWTLLALGLWFIGMRMWVRWTQVGFSGWQLDDYLMPVTGVVFTLETAAAYLVGAMFGGLTNSYMTDEQRAALSPNSKEYSDRVWGSKIQVIGWSFYVFILWSLKVCLAVFYSRLTSGLAHLTMRVRIAYALLGVTYVAVALSILLGCQPMERYWQIYPDPGNLCQPTISRLYVLVVVIPNVITDLYLLSIPLPAGPEGAISGSQWACRETFVSVIVTNLPVVQPLVRKCADRVGLSALFSRSTRAVHSYSLRSREVRGDCELRRKTRTDLHSVPQGAAWDSDEHILGMMDQVAQEISIQTDAVAQKEPGASSRASLG
ncbi:hypothetical protein BFJ63_vAg17308 [Fusarium oxysporum f. sp. narcissi]|uniref:Rhodopsin domain-containing protein n=1 Tax=Fusarium oxysporum f. sp. narcissi TaxID=451672 RepID=A0A4Q2UZ68_FUSOX|nr:hypothetical protein BFJ63_vAg17308 [Fusarium oxysporum f. sp. narcissi]